MALQGSLKDLRLGDVLQTILQTGNHGRLHVRSGGRRAVLHVAREGIRLLEPEALDARMILDALVHRRVIQEAVVNRLRAAKETTDAIVLKTLVSSTVLSPREYDSLVANAAEDCVLDVLGWNEGEFRFEEGVDLGPSPSLCAQVALEPGSLFLRAAQRIDESKQILERIGQNAVLVMPIEGAAAPEDLDPTEACVLGHLDGHALLEEAALTEGLTPFAAQKAAANLVGAGLARLPTPEELAAQAAAREAAADVRGATEVLWQWQAEHPDETAPFEASAALAARAGRSEDETASLKALGLVLLRGAHAQEAYDVFDRLLQRRPGDADGLDGLRLAARAVGTRDVWARTTRMLAEQALDSEDAARAASLLVDLLEVVPNDLDARLLYAKAMVRVGDRGGAIEQFERLAADLPARCRRKGLRDAATYCRDTILRLAPDRADLLRAFRSRLESGVTGAKKRLLIGGSLVAVLAAVGMVVWPHPARNLLAQAREAAGRGDVTTALSLIGQIEEGYPDAPEVTEAAALRVSVTRHAPAGPAGPTDETLAALRKAATEVRASLPRWPDAAALDRADELTALLRAPGAAGLVARRAVAEIIGPPLGEVVSALRREALARRDALDMAPRTVARPPSDVLAFRGILDRAQAALDPAWPAAARRAAATARRLVSPLAETDGPLRPPEDLRYLEADVEAAARAVSGRAEDVERLRLEYHRALILDAYEKARGDAVKLLVRGDLAGAETYYRRLSDLLDVVDKDTGLRPLRDMMERRGIVAFSHTKLEMLRTIREGLAAAGEAEKTGNLAGAARAYARLVEQFPLVRFDEVFTVPVRVLTVPPDAHVALNGRDLETVAGGPVVARYGWGSQVTLTVTAEGYEPASLVLRTAEAQPEPEVQVHLVPKARWSQPLVGTVESPLLGIDGDVVVCNRSGRVERRSKDTGEIVWAAETHSLEGVRGRPALAGQVLWVPLVEGRAARVSAATGVLLSDVPLRGRPVGDAAAVGGHAAVAIEDGVALLGADASPAYAAVPAPLTAGVLAAHGAFWVGDLEGRVARVDPASGETTSLSVPGHHRIVALAAGATSVYAVSDDGALHAIDPRASAVRWTRPGLGDVSGTPAEGGDMVAVADQSGHVRFFGAADGAPRGERMIGAEVRGEIVTVGSRLVAALADGRLWACSASDGTVIVDAALKGAARFPAGPTGDGGVAVPGPGPSLVVLTLPK